MRNFENLTSRIIDYYLKTNPVQATAAGVHDYDHQLDNLDADFHRERSAQLKEFLRESESLRLAGAKPDVRLDGKVLAGGLRAAILHDQDFCLWARDPSYAVEAAIYGCYLLALREFAPLDERARNVVERMRCVPRLIADAKRNLQNEPGIPTVWAEMGEEMARTGATYFSGLAQSLGEKLPRLSAELSEAGNAAAAACDDYLRFLKEKIVNRTPAGYALGERGYNELLVHLHGLTYTGADLTQLGKDVISETIAEMTRIAAEINPASNAAEIIEQLKRRTPPLELLVEYYRAFVSGARQHLIDHKLVTVPKVDNLLLVDTPLFARPTFPYAGYMPAAPFDDIQQGFFWVTPIDKQAPADHQEQQKRGHNQYQALIVSLHEAYPGHHLQMQRANRVESRVRKLFVTTVFIEGWALYCEEMMYETGYYPDKETRLMQLALQLWRACRVVIDVGLHTGTMTFDEAVAFLVDTAKLERVSALAEVKRYTQSPTQPMSYIVGKMEILRLREDYRRHQGGRFRLKEFHDHLLSYGSIPISLVRDSMLEQK